MASGGQHFASGVIVGTGADLSVEKVGFKPTIVWIVNYTDPGFAVYIEGMDADTMIKHQDGATTKASTNGITLTDSGFDLGADTDFNVDGEVVFYEIRG